MSRRTRPPRPPRSLKELLALPRVLDTRPEKIKITLEEAAILLDLAPGTVKNKPTPKYMAKHGNKGFARLKAGGGMYNYGRVMVERNRLPKEDGEIPVRSTEAGGWRGGPKLYRAILERDRRRQEFRVRCRRFFPLTTASLMQMVEERVALMRLEEAEEEARTAK